MLSHSSRKLYWLLLVLATSACSLARADVPELNVDLTEQLPASWTPVEPLIPVNIDGDPRPESPALVPLRRRKWAGWCGHF